ncbi:MAG: DEAD/DEAH box helicase [Erysipelothrix sp.]|jgi:competence protein ComFA|nr:DEAD/DEAH box helicase [Erysipelothrix sp.]
MPCEYCKSKHKDLSFIHQAVSVCRVCLSVATLEPIEVTCPNHLIEDINLSFELTPKQKEVSKQLCYTHDKNVLFEAVCGAGKTECVLELIQDRLNKGFKVGWAIPRRQVVLELTLRLQKVFPSLTVIAVCEGYTTQLAADLVLFTTHQAFRYKQSFDVLILDEVDAFPYKGNHLLQHLVSQTYKHQCIMMSATIPHDLRKTMVEEKWSHITCYERPTHIPLSIPVHIRTFSWLMLFWIFKLRPRQKKWLIFVPSIRQAIRYAQVLRCDVLTSKSEDKDKIIEHFSNTQQGTLVCTTILERGVTFINVHVMVIMAHHSVFDESSLVQIAGRVGRHKMYPTGDVFFISSQDSEEVNACISTLQNANATAYGV